MATHKAVLALTVLTAGCMPPIGRPASVISEGTTLGTVTLQLATATNDDGDRTTLPFLGASDIKGLGHRTDVTLGFLNSLFYTSLRYQVLGEASGLNRRGFYVSAEVGAGVVMWPQAPDSYLPHRHLSAGLNASWEDEEGGGCYAAWRRYWAENEKIDDLTGVIDTNRLVVDRLVVGLDIALNTDRRLAVELTYSDAEDKTSTEPSYGVAVAWRF